MPRNNSSEYYDSAFFWMFVVFFTSIVFSFRAVSSISIALILVTGIIYTIKSGRPVLQKDIPTLFVNGCAFLFLMKAIALVYSDNLAEGLEHLQRSSALVVIPLSVYCCRNFLNRVIYGKLMLFYVTILAVACIYCLTISFFRYNGGSDSSVFFYHRLVQPISQHAIQFSILIFIASIHLLGLSRSGTTDSRLPKFWLWLLLSLFTAFLLLLSSKLVIVIYFLYLALFLLWNPVKKFRRSHIAASIISASLVLSILIATPNPIAKRFSEIFSGDIELVSRQEFDPGIYFNGLQFRLLQWRFVYEILNEQQAWGIGLSPGDAQEALNRKYIETKMYTGNGNNDSGFLGYHTHNQFLQVLLQNGIIGLAVFVFIWFILLKMAAVRKNARFNAFLVLLFLYCFADAVLETQYGLVIFCFFPVFYFLGVNRE
jgi:O-antigen ligase